MKTTPFTETHIALGAKMHEFAGYNMPIEYSGIIDEHMTVCNGVGVFDVSHMGEGCLSVNREVEGIIPRYARVTVSGYDVDGNKIHVRAREEVAIAFQHEIDHLNGIIFIDRIDKKNPFKDKENMRAI